MIHGAGPLGIQNPHLRGADGRSRRPIRTVRPLRSPTRTPGPRGVEASHLVPGLTDAVGTLRRVCGVGEAIPKSGAAMAVADRARWSPVTAVNNFYKITPHLDRDY